MGKGLVSGGAERVIRYLLLMFLESEKSFKRI